MTSEPLDVLGRSVRGGPDEDRLRAGLERLQVAAGLSIADQAAVTGVLAQLLSISADVDHQTVMERRRIEGFLSSFGGQVADVVAPTRHDAFTDVSPGCRPLAVALHARLRQERQFDVIAPILAAASIRHRHGEDQGWLVLATVLESLLRLPVELVGNDRRRLNWYGQQLFEFWLEPSEVALLVHTRWRARLPADELQRWRALVPERRPFATDELLAELVNSTHRAS
jgi:hypothetical protein